MLSFPEKTCAWRGSPAGPSSLAARAISLLTPPVSARAPPMAGTPFRSLSVANSAFNTELSG